MCNLNIKSSYSLMFVCFFKLKPRLGYEAKSQTSNVLDSLLDQEDKQQRCIK